MSVTTQDIKKNFYQFTNSDISGNDISGFGTTIKGCYETCRDNSDCYAFTIDSNSDEPSTSVRCQIKKQGEYWDTKDPSFTSGWTTWVKKPRNLSNNTVLEDWIYPIFNIFYPELIIQRRIVEFNFQRKSEGEVITITQNSKCENSGDVFNDKNCEADQQKIFLSKSNSKRKDNNTCLKDYNKYCVKLDDIATCSITDFPGKCATDSCGYGGDWGNIIGNNSFDKGFINCKYSFDYTNFSFNDLTPFKKYIDTLYSNTVGMANNLKDRFRDSNYIYACIINFYSSIYGQYYYSGQNAINNFRSFDYLKRNINEYKTVFFSYINTQIQQYFQQSIVPLDLQHIVEDSMQLPDANIIQGNPRTYTINLKLPYAMFKTYIDKNQQERDTYISILLEGFLRDKEGKIQDNSSGNSWYSNRCDIISTDITKIYTVNVSNSSYSDTTELNYSDYNDSRYKDYLFLYANITGTVNVWTPMVSVYFQVKNNVTSLDTVTCDAISSQAGYNSTNTSLYPYVCFQRLCLQTDKSNCVNKMPNVCKMSYSPPRPFISGFINKYLTTVNSTQCACYTSTLSPVSENEYGNVAAMCFDKKCDDPDLRQAFNLSDSNCKQYLDKVWNWITPSNSSEKSRNSITFDSQRFNRLAGENYKPYQPSTYNWQLLLIGIFTSVLLCLITFILCRTYKISVIFTVIDITLVILIFGGLTAFFCKDMAGLSSCDGKNFKCKSKYTNIEIPKQFCNYTLNCECQLNEDCSPCSYCFSGTCAPSSGFRKTVTVQERQPNIVIIILSIILLVLLPTVLMFLHNEKFLNIPSWIFNTVVILVCLIPLIIILYTSLKKIDIVKYDGSCKQECDNSCEGKTCGYNDCGKSCGECPQGYTCNENNVCEKYLA
jgi:hypothetical protein